MAISPDAGFNLQVTGSNNGTWGTNLNSNFSIANNIYGARVTVNCAGSSNITLTTSQAQNFFQILTGALTGNILYILPATGGQFFIINNTTGAYTVTVVNNAAGTGIVVAQGSQQYVASQPDNTTVYGVIPSSLSLSSLSISGQITSTQATGTAPFVVASTTPVANLSIGGNAATATNSTTATTAGTCTGNAATATALAVGGTIAITGDISYTSPTFTGSNVTAVGTLATVNSNVGTFTNATVITNGKGLITGISSASPAITKGATYTVACSSLTSSGRFTNAHGMGSPPNGFTAYLQCTTANNGYSIGDIIPYSNWSPFSAGNWSYQISLDATNVNISTNTAVDFTAVPKGGGSAISLTAADFNLVIIPTLI